MTSNYQKGWLTNKVESKRNVWRWQKNNTVIRLPHKWYAGTITPNVGLGDGLEFEKLSLGTNAE